VIASPEKQIVKHPRWRKLASYAPSLACPVAQLVTLCFCFGI
jgi:hypothetical protein